MEGSLVTRGRRRSKKIINEIVKRDLYINDLNINMIYNRIQ